MVVRYLAERIGQWVPGYVLVAKASSMIGKDYIIQDADTRAHDLVREGHYDSPNFRYFIESRKQGKYTQFRISHKEPITHTPSKEQREKDRLKAIAFFDSYQPTP